MNSIQISQKREAQTHMISMEEQYWKYIPATAFTRPPTQLGPQLRRTNKPSSPRVLCSSQLSWVILCSTPAAAVSRAPSVISIKKGSKCGAAPNKETCTRKKVGISNKLAEPFSSFGNSGA